MSPEEMVAEGNRLSALLDKALLTLHSEILVLANAERDYRKAAAKEWLKVQDRDEFTAAAKEAWVKGETADLRYVRDLAEGKVRGCHQAIRARQTQISLLQSMANAYRAEAEFVRTAA